VNAKQKERKEEIALKPVKTEEYNMDQNWAFTRGPTFLPYKENKCRALYETAP
jgi:hypothetical protein